VNVVDTIPVAEGIELRAIAAADFGRYWELIERNRAYLARWLAWAPAASFESTCAFLGDQAERHAQGQVATYGIWIDGRLVGSIGLRNLEQPAELNVGYYLAEIAQGRGIMSAALRALCAVAFETFGAQRIELVAALGNLASRRVAERCGFRFEGIARGRVVARDRLHDAAVYARLATDA
jgi:ribosomal-protein-serine acetyltransferase